MNNPKSPKDRSAVKGAIMRVFARSELHEQVINESIIKWSDDSRPRVKTWCRCSVCKKAEAISYMAVDHINPKVPVTTSLADMTWDELVNNTWCEIKDLQSICPVCHDEKTKRENVERKKNKKGKK